MKNINEIIKINRKNLSKVSSFVNIDDWKNSPDNYGLPHMVVNVINKPFNDEITYIDLILYLQQYLKSEKKVYVEIGVSVLKTFYQIASYLQNSELYAYDINKINPTIEKLFEKINIENNPSIYNFNKNLIGYYQGDVYKKEDFEGLIKNINTKANIIFSDACHRPDALINEYEYFIKNVLDDEFILYYDDLGEPNIQKAFFEIAQRIFKLKNIKPKNHVALVKVNGWLGQHDVVGKHINGVISSLNLKDLISNLNFEKKIFV